jgi:hypothetical protein
MATAWASFYPYVQPHVPGCPEIVMESHLQEAAAEFCMLSEVWRFDIDPDFTSRNTADYEIDVPTNAILENILVLNLNGLPLKRVSDKYYTPLLDQDGKPVSGLPMYYMNLDDASIRLFPTPDKKYTFNGRAVLKPKLSATGIEDFLFETHGRCIAYGAIARLAAIPAKEWTNPELANYYRAKFVEDTSKARGRDTRRVNLRIQAQSFDGSNKTRTV